MDCTWCEDPMEREDGYLRNSEGKILTKSATYACLTCGREWRWERGTPGLLPLFAPADYPAPLDEAEAWINRDAEEPIDGYDPDQPGGLQRNRGAWWLHALTTRGGAVEGHL